MPKSLARQARLGDYFSNRQEPGTDGLPVMSVTMNDSLVFRDDLDRRLESALRPDQHLLVKKGDIAYNMMRMWQGACGLAEADGIVSPAYVVLAPKPGIDSRFAYHWFKSARMIHLFWAYSHGLTEDRLRLYFDEFSEIPVAPPPLEKQRRISTILNSWDEAIHLAERSEAAGKARYRGELDRIMRQNNANSCRIDQICNVNVRSLSTKTDSAFEFDYFDIASAEDGTEDDLSGRIRFGSAPSRARRMVAEEGVVYSTVRPLLRRLFTAKRRDDAVYSTGYSILEPKVCCSSAYLKHALISEAVERQVYARLTGSGYPAISEKDLAEVNIPLPTTDRQKAVCETLDALERMHSMYGRYAIALRNQKRGLSQRLLAAEWPLDERFDPLPELAVSERAS
jgi:type I restriction enzyme, S subunit